MYLSYFCQTLLKFRKWDENKKLDFLKKHLCSYCCCCRMGSNRPLLMVLMLKANITFHQKDTPAC